MKLGLRHHRNQNLRSNGRTRLSSRICSLTFRLLFLFVAITGARLSQADPLTDILDSPTLNRGSVARTSNQNLESNKWFGERSNLALLFKQGDKGGLYLLEWMGEVISSEYSIVTKEARRQPKFIGFYAKYRSSLGAQVGLRILIPHPLYQDQVTIGLIEEFASIEPPRLPILSLEKMEIRGNDAMLYERKNGGCSLVIKLPGEGRLNLEVEDCKDSHLMTRLAELGDVTRLKNKLES